MSQVQAILFDKKHFSPESSLKWLKDHDFRPIKKVHETENYYRYRMTEPKGHKNFRTIDFNNNIKAVIYF